MRAVLVFLKRGSFTALASPDKRFALCSFGELEPGGDPAMENVCEVLVTGSPFWI